MKRLMTATLAAALMAAGCGGQTFSKKPDEVFAQAVEASQTDDPALAAAAAYHYVEATNLDDPRHDRALRLLARSSEQLGLRYAASLWYLDIARSRRDVELVDDAVAGLERLMDEGGVDRDTVVEGFVATADVSGLPDDQRAFIAYHQGLDSLKRGLDEWAEKTFATIPEDSPYYLKARYVRAIDRIASGYEVAEARADLEAMLEDYAGKPALTEAVRQDIERALARIDFEQGRYDDALAHYETLRKAAPDEPTLLLEMAWANYYQGNYQRALGLLLALDAPVYGDLIAPERFLLEALSLRQLCQFEPARKAAVRLESRHGEALDDLYRGVPLDDSDEIRSAARLRPGGHEVGAFRVSVEREAQRVEALSDELGPKLTARLRQLYAHGLAEARRQENEHMMGEMQRLAGELLSAREGVQLILHELGVGLLRGRRPTGERASIQQLEIPAWGPEVYYRFNGEFWTDEIDDLVVDLEDRCID